MKIDSQNIILRISDLTISGKNNEKITDGLNIDIERSKITGLVGASGSGKTLTAMAILGLTKYIDNLNVTGKILFNDTNAWLDLSDSNEKQLTAIRGKKIALIMQDPLSSFDPNKKCGVQLMEVLKLHNQEKIKSAKDLISGLLEKMSLENRVLDAYPHQLSGGELQRFAIAIAISSDPELIIADEPTTNLDANLTNSILNIFKDINREKGITILLISHDLKAVKSICDNIAIIHEGKMIEYNNAEDFFKNPTTSYSKQLLDAYFNFSLPDKLNKIPLHELEILNISNVSKSFGSSSKIPFLSRSPQVQALKNISFNLDAGETLGIIGQSGSGKSTIARILVRLETPDGGNIQLSGRDISSHSSSITSYIRENIQIVFQNPLTSLNRLIKVKKLLGEPYETPLYRKGEKNSDPEELIKQLGIDKNIIDRYPDQISGGEAQRIALARVLALNPKVIILDESLSSLDRISQNEILLLLNDIQEKYNTSFIFITHDNSLARYFCDRIIIMENGKIIEQGNRDEIFNSPVDQYTKSLIYATS